MNNAKREKYLKAYEYADKIFNLKPWKWFDEKTVISIHIGKNDACDISVMGNRDMFYGIFITDSKVNFAKYKEMQKDNIFSLVGINYQNGILVSPMAPYDIIPDNIKVLKECNRKIEKEEKNLCFESFEFGYMPSLLNNNELDMVIKYFNVFTKFIDAINKAKGNDDEISKGLAKLSTSTKELINKEIVVNYDKKNDTLDYKVVEQESYDYYLEELSKKYRPSDKKIESLKNVFHNKETLQIEFLNCLPIRIGDITIGTKYKDNKTKETKEEKIEKLGLSMFNIIANTTLTRVVSFGFRTMPIKNKIDLNSTIKSDIERMIRTFSESGIPKKIEVRDRLTYFILDDMCKKLNIKLSITDRMDMVDFVYINMYESFTKGGIKEMLSINLDELFEEDEFDEDYDEYDKLDNIINFDDYNVKAYNDDDDDEYDDDYDDDDYEDDDDYYFGDDDDDDYDDDDE